MISCDFRASGLLSQESTRQLRALHEGFARALSHSLDLFLGSPLEVKLLRVDQVGVREFGSEVANGSYLVPLGVQPAQDRVILRFDNALLFPLLDVLLGGNGDASEHSRELTEIDEELVRSVTELMGSQLERSWRGLNVSVAPLASIKAVMLGQLFALDERVVTVTFSIHLGVTSATFTLVLPIGFASTLVRSTHAEPAWRVALQASSKKRLRDRMLQCTMQVSVNMESLTVSAGDLASLEVGKVLNLRAGIRTPVLLQIEGHPLFDITPVRQGPFKAARLERQHVSEDECTQRQ